MPKPSKEIARCPRCGVLLFEYTGEKHIHPKEKDCIQALKQELGFYKTELGAYMKQVDRLFHATEKKRPEGKDSLKQLTDWILKELR